MEFELLTAATATGGATNHTITAKIPASSVVFVEATRGEATQVAFLLTEKLEAFLDDTVNESLREEALGQCDFLVFRLDTAKLHERILLERALEVFFRDQIPERGFSFDVQLTSEEELKRGEDSTTQREESAAVKPTDPAVRRREADACFREGLKDFPLVDENNLYFVKGPEKKVKVEPPAGGGKRGRPPSVAPVGPAEINFATVGDGEKTVVACCDVARVDEASLTKFGLPEGALILASPPADIRGVFSMVTNGGGASVVLTRGNVKLVPLLTGNAPLAGPAPPAAVVAPAISSPPSRAPALDRAMRSGGTVKPSPPVQIID